MTCVHNLDCAVLSNYPTFRVIYKAESVNSEEGSYKGDLERYWKNIKALSMANTFKARTPNTRKLNKLSSSIYFIRLIW